MPLNFLAIMPAFAALIKGQRLPLAQIQIPTEDPRNFPASRAKQLLPIDRSTIPLAICPPQDMPSRQSLVNPGKRHPQLPEQHNKAQISIKPHRWPSNSRPARWVQWVPPSRTRVQITLARNPTQWHQLRLVEGSKLPKELQRQPRLAGSCSERPAAARKAP